MMLFGGPTAHGQLQPVPPEPAGPAEAKETIVVQLNSGTRLRGTLQEETDEFLVLDADGLGETTVAKSSIATRLKSDVKLGPNPTKAELPAPGLFGTTILDGFDKSISLGISGREAESSDLTLNVAADANFNGDDRRWRFSSAYFYSTSDGNRTQDEGFANLRRDWKLPARPPFIFAEGRLQYDDFQAWQFRAGGFAGVGYSVSGKENVKKGQWPRIRNEDLTLLGRVGVGGSYEWGTINAFMPEALVAVEAGYAFDGNKTISFINTLFPDLEDTGEYRNTTELTAGMTLDQARGLSLKVGAFNEYLSMTEGDTPHNSLTYFVRLVLDF